MNDTQSSYSMPFHTCMFVITNVDSAAQQPVSGMWPRIWMFVHAGPEHTESQQHSAPELLRAASSGTKKAVSGSQGTQSVVFIYFYPQIPLSYHHHTQLRFY